MSSQGTTSFQTGRSLSRWRWGLRSVSQWCPMRSWKRQVERPRETVLGTKSSRIRTWSTFRSRSACHRIQRCSNRIMVRNLYHCQFLFVEHVFVLFSPCHYFSWSQELLIWQTYKFLLLVIILKLLQILLWVCHLDKFNRILPPRIVCPTCTAFLELKRYKCA